MSLITKLENLQKKPEILKKRLLIISMAVFMFIVVVIWVTTFKFSLEKDKKLETASTPFAIFRNLAKDGLRFPKVGVEKGVDLVKQFYGKVYGAER